MKRRISQGQATLSVFGRARVTHFMDRFSSRGASGVGHSAPIMGTISADSKTPQLAGQSNPRLLRLQTHRQHALTMRTWSNTAIVSVVVAAIVIAILPSALAYAAPNARLALTFVREIRLPGHATRFDYQS